MSLAMSSVVRDATRLAYMSADGSLDTSSKKARDASSALSLGASTKTTHANESAALTTAVQNRAVASQPHTGVETRAVARSVNAPKCDERPIPSRTNTAVALASAKFTQAAKRSRLS